VELDVFTKEAIWAMGVEAGAGTAMERRAWAGGLSRQGRNSQIVKIDQGTGGQSGKGVLVGNFPGESNVFNFPAEELICRDSLVVCSIPFHGFCNGNC